MECWVKVEGKTEKKKPLLLENLLKVYAEHMMFLFLRSSTHNVAAASPSTRNILSRLLTLEQQVTSSNILATYSHYRNLLLDPVMKEPRAQFYDIVIACKKSFFQIDIFRTMLELSKEEPISYEEQQIAKVLDKAYSHHLEQGSVEALHSHLLKILVVFTPMC
ncbi:15830_t:CDS:2 [Dentiscutata erythropus]|uniref:15830_t:CDS:1 n=1 Tax=Dentiscutata erythropus TaxID=1348616 RepID=A0A9N8ZNI4_9GLOM|nr:15830_t:CDS:2 [Dentiscutata erythropus]